MTEPTGGKVFAVLGLFSSPDALLSAVPRLAARRLGRLEAYTPYPVHGLDRALGLRKSPLGGMVLVMGIIGAVSAMGFQWWTSAVDYPIWTGGKRLFSWEAFVPVMFEVTVLFATFTAGLGMLFLLSRLPRFSHPILRSRSMAAVTRDRFALSIEAEAAPIDAEAARAALLEAGAEAVETLPMPEASGPRSPRVILRVCVAIVGVSVVSGLATYWAVKLFPVLPPMVYMQDQPKVKPQKSSVFFKDGFAMRLPPAGTVARGFLPYLVKDQEAAATLANPLPRSREVLLRGKRIYDTFCTVCHGPLGNGSSALTNAYGAKPANLLSQTFVEYPDGKLYHVLVAGKNSMPAWTAELRPDDRWAVVHHVRALQRAQNAKDEDLKQ
jgi:mono/diheme cytochrome c family protein